MCHSLKNALKFGAKLGKLSKETIENGRNKINYLNNVSLKLFRQKKYQHSLFKHFCS
jgi:hypothetical protein